MQEAADVILFEMFLLVADEVLFLWVFAAEQFENITAFVGFV